MFLGSYNNLKKHYNALRELTPQEVELNEKFIPIFAEARERLSLFRILEKNYLAWKGFINQLLSANFREENDVPEELNRLLLNYLTCAYTIQEHFKVSYRQRFKRHPLNLKRYDAFIDKLCGACWPFAFLLDYRGYVQHVGLGISNYHRSVGDTSVSLHVLANSNTLLAGTKDWKRSGLKGSRGDIDLVATLKEFHAQMLQSYGAFVASTFFPELKPANEFYSLLTREVKSTDPAAIMIFFSSLPQSISKDGGTQTITMNLVEVPNDVFGQLGIKPTNP